MNISNSEQVIDSRDVIERLEELENDLEVLEDNLLSAENTLEVSEEGEDQEDIEAAQEEVDQAKKELEEWKEDNQEELEALKELQDEAEGYVPDWIYGATLIHEDYFTEYAIDMLKDCSVLPQDIPHYIVIDEEATADNIKVDYTEIDFQGSTYYIR